MFWFNGLSTLAGYLRPNLVYIYIYIYIYILPYPCGVELSGEESNGCH